MRMEPSLHDRIRGGLLGTLVGDALGVPVEFSSRSARDLDPVVDMRGFGTWNQPSGTWSDDGAMALATADMLTTHGWQPQQLMEGFRRWLDGGFWAAHGMPFDVGNATRNAIMLYRIHGDWSNCGQDSEWDNGNGSLMRCFPVSAWLVGASPTDRIRLAGEASALTHAHIRSRLCCAWHAQWCEATLSERDVGVAAAQVNARLRRDVPPAEWTHLARLLDGTILQAPRDSVNSSGYVVATLEASLWCVARHGSFSEMVLAAVNLGGDTDTTGAVTGGMAGWLLGAGAIPETWLSALPRRGEVEDLATRFAERCLDQWSAHGPR